MKVLSHLKVFIFYESLLCHSWAVILGYLPLMQKALSLQVEDKINVFTKEKLRKI